MQDLEQIKQDLGKFSDNTDKCTEVFYHATQAFADLHRTDPKYPIGKIAVPQYDLHWDYNGVTLV
jgi:hypothetical protein